MTQTCFLFLVGPLQDRMFRLAYCFLRDVDEAKDVVQDALVKIWEKRDLLSDIENVEAWCIRIAKNTVLDRLKYNSHRMNLGMEGHKEIFAATDTQKMAEIKDAFHYVEKIISRLPEKQQFFIHLRDVEGFTYNEIAEIMELSLPEVKVGIFRARQIIRENLKTLNSYGLR
jgi:RNA polymerase sigma-70 factor (ECF subfamily)